MTTPGRTVRTVGDDEDLRAYLENVAVGFLAPSRLTDESVDWHRERIDLDRSWVAVDDGRVCGTARTFPSTVHVPGGALVPVSCLTQVTVRPTHTRRGHLRRLMTAQLRATAESGEVASVLIAAEWPIYGRFGYGPATEWAEWKVDRTRARVLGEPTGICELTRVEELDPIAEAIGRHQHERTVGSIERPAVMRRVDLGVDRPPERQGATNRLAVVHRDAEGRPDGYAVYDATQRWSGMRPDSKLEVAELVAVDAVAERELWRYLLEVDLVSEVTWSGPPHASLPHLLVDGRAARRAGTWDFLWIRLEDVAAALAQRGYRGEDRLVVEVVDPFGRAGGRFLLDAGPDGATCERTSAPADVVLPLGALGAGWLGTTDLRTLGVAGTLEEPTPGASARLARLLRSDTTAWCSTDF